MALESDSLGSNPRSATYGLRTLQEFQVSSIKAQMTTGWGKIRD